MIQLPASYRFAAGLALGAMGMVVAAHAGAANLQEQCRSLSGPEIATAVNTSPKRTELTQRDNKEVRVFSADKPISFELGGAPLQGIVYCARLLRQDRFVEVIDVIPGAGDPPKTTSLALGLPNAGWLDPLRRQEELVVVGLPLTADGTKLDKTAPAIAARQVLVIGNSVGCGAIAVGVVLAAYLIAVWGLGRVNGGSWAIDPVVLTAGASGKASLSQLQMFGFTLLVLWVLVFVLLRIGVLSDISSDLLLLLGISAAGTGGSKVANVLKKRLSAEGWSWLRNNGWLTAYEQGIGAPRKAELARWGDLLKTDGQFDVYCFQLATSSAVVGLGILMSDLSTLAQLEVPKNLLALMGLSNVVYVGGKAVNPNSVGELDDTVAKLREKEGTWVAAVVSVVTSLPDQNAKQAAAKAAAPDKAADYLLSAREAARLLQSIYGKDGTKFTRQDIQDDELMPQFP